MNRIALLVRHTIAAMFLVPASCGVVMPAALVLTAADRVEKDRRYLGCFHLAAMRPNAVLPERCPEIWRGGSFADDNEPIALLGTPPPGQAVMSFWRGEWFEFYAPWSGKTTLLATRASYWRAFAPQFGIWLLIGVAAAIGARLACRRRTRIPAARAGAVSGCPPPRPRPKPLTDAQDHRAL